MNEQSGIEVASLGRSPKAHADVSETELLGLRTRVMWKYITVEEPGSGDGNPVIPIVLLALARYPEASFSFLELLSQIYGAGIQQTVDRLVREGLVERIADAEGEFYRLKFFPRGYEEHIASIEDPVEYLRYVAEHRQASV